MCQDERGPRWRGELSLPASQLTVQVICAFPRHSTSLFSLNDSPAESSARVRHGSVVPPNAESNTRRAEKRNRERDGREEAEAVGAGVEAGEAVMAEEAADAAEKAVGSSSPSSSSPSPHFPTPPTTTPGAPKRRISSLSRPESRPSARQRTDDGGQRTDDGGEEARENVDEAMRLSRAQQFLRSPPRSPPHERAGPQRDRRPLGTEWGRCICLTILTKQKQAPTRSWTCRCSLT